MLPAGNRLRRREDFATAVRRGRRAGRPHLVVHLYQLVEADPAGEDSTPGIAQPSPPSTTPNPVPERSDASRHGDEDPHVPVEESPPPRAGFVVSKAVGKAVVRNRVKRRLRHLMGPRLAVLAPGSLVVVRALPPAAEAGYDALAADLDAALSRLLGRGGRPRAGKATAAPGAKA